MSFERRSPDLFVVHYERAPDLAPERNAELVQALQAANAELGRRVNVVFVVGPAVRSVDVGVPGFWLGVTAEPSCPLRAMAIVSQAVAVRVAAKGFLLAGALRGSRLRVASFLTEGEALAWVAT